MSTIIRDGYMQNAQGHLIPLDQVKEIDKVRDEFVREKVAKVKIMQKALKELKTELMGDVAAFVEMSAERYDAKVGGDKGNLTLRTFDDQLQIKLQVSNTLVFDEGLRAAKALIDECLEEWSKSSPSPLRAIVEQVFSVNREGHIDTKAILGLRQHNIEDDRWQRAMQAIGDSLTVLDTRAYVRVYERDASGKPQPISLDMAVL